MIVVARLGGQKFSNPHLARVLGSSLLVVTVNYGLLFWGAQFLPSGVSGLLSFGSVALSLTVLSFLTHSEMITLPKLLGLAFGLLGLGLLSVTKLNAYPEQFRGGVAIFLGGVSYAAGSLLVRPALKQYGALRVTTLQMAAGGGVLFLLGLITEAPEAIPLQALREPTTLLSLLYLVGIGSLLGFWLYNRLLMTWEGSTLALYNFVSPLVALFLGALVYREVLSWPEAAAALCLLGGVLFRYLGRAARPMSREEDKSHELTSK